MKLLAALSVLPFVMVCLAVAQEVKTPRVSNLPRIARLWNSAHAETPHYNEAMAKANDLLHERFDSKIVLVDPDLKRKETVAAYKAAREALLNETALLNELIEEEDY
jgi:hypothetical protein